MNLQGERTIPASVEKTWTALNDPETLKACIAGCESIESTGENQYLVVMAVRIGPVNAKFKGRLQLSDIVPMQSYKINFDGQGGVAGFGKGSANVTLAPDGDSGQSTRLNYVADAQVGGKIAQVGSRLVESAAGKVADDFFKAFETRMTGPAEEAPASGTAPAVATDAMPPRPVPTLDHVAGRNGPAQPGGGGGGSTIWWIAGIIVLALLFYFFTR
jgi:carbon monoxide dehydrogenase subunit G